MSWSSRRRNSWRPSEVDLGRSLEFQASRFRDRILGLYSEPLLNRVRAILLERAESIGMNMPMVRDELDGGRPRFCHFIPDFPSYWHFKDEYPRILAFLGDPPDPEWATEIKVFDQLVSEAQNEVHPNVSSLTWASAYCYYNPLLKALFPNLPTKSFQRRPASKFNVDFFKDAPKLKHVCLLLQTGNPQ